VVHFKTQALDVAVEEVADVQVFGVALLVLRGLSLVAERTWKFLGELHAEGNSVLACCCELFGFELERTRGMVDEGERVFLSCQQHLR